MSGSAPENAPVNPTDSRPVRPKKKYVPAVTPRLKIALVLVFVLFALLMANSVYLLTITAAEYVTGLQYQDYFYLLMFLLHLALGILLLVPFTIFSYFHLLATFKRKNRTAVRMGYGLFFLCLILLVSGILLMRIVGVIELKHQLTRQLVYWAHVISPLGVMWLYWLHRLSGPPIKWRVAVSYCAITGVVVAGLLVVRYQDPRKWSQAGAPESAQYFEPSLARTNDAKFIKEEVLMNDKYCLQCHADIHKDWQKSAHRFSSFNNPAYLTSVVQLREELVKRDGHVKASRFCAGCHDPVPFFSGKFDNPEYDVFKDPTAHSGITCTVCHSITNINSTRGNADYTIEAPIHYPFANSENVVLKTISNQLVKSKPSFHKKSMMKPLHKSPDFCGSCHKVHLPGVLNNYKDWLRGQNHFDPYWLSGVSGNGARSFYYPKMAEKNCNECHMPKLESGDFGAQLADDGKFKVHDHKFLSANTALGYFFDMPDVIEAHKKFNNGVMRVDIFGLKEGNRDVTQPVIGPIRPEVPALKPGQNYLLETVVRTVKMGHLFTQGTVDSNEVWLDVRIIEGAEYNDKGELVGGKIVGRSGGMNDVKGVDPYSHFMNVFMLDRNGNRVNRRNAQDIFTPLYNHQIPPGAGQVVHYEMAVPNDVAKPLTVEVKLKYRKFDQEYMNIIANFHREKKLKLKGDTGEGDYVNELPVMVMAEDKVTFPIAGGEPLGADANPKRDIPEWQRWNDYGIGLLLEGRDTAAHGELRQAEHAFQEVEKLKVFSGPINQARVYLAEARYEDAQAALTRANEMSSQEGFPFWTVLWLTGMINREQGNLEQAIEDFKHAATFQSEDTQKRKFDFSKDYEMVNELARTIYKLAETKDHNSAEQIAMLNETIEWRQKVLAIDSENVAAHYNLAQIYEQLKDVESYSQAEREEFAKLAVDHQTKYERYKVDDNAAGLAVIQAKQKYDAANKASEDIVIYELQRKGAYELPVELEGRLSRTEAANVQAESGGE